MFACYSLLRLRLRCEVLWSACMSVCVFVYLSVRSHISKTTRPNFTFSVRVTCGRGSVLLWRQCNTLCTSSFVNDVMFSHNIANWQNQRRRECFVEFARWRSLPTASCFATCAALLCRSLSDRKMMLEKNHLRFDQNGSMLNWAGFKTRRSFCDAAVSS